VGDNDSRSESMSSGDDENMDNPLERKRNQGRIHQIQPRPVTLRNKNNSMDGLVFVDDDDEKHVVSQISSSSASLVKTRRRKGTQSDDLDNEVDDDADEDQLMGIDDEAIGIEDNEPTSTFKVPITKPAGGVSTYGTDICGMIDIQYMQVGKRRDREVDEELRTLAKCGDGLKSVASKERAKVEWTVEW
jgi:hypothetical protein